MFVRDNGAAQAAKRPRSLAPAGIYGATPSATTTTYAAAGSAGVHPVAPKVGGIASLGGLGL